MHFVRTEFPGHKMSAFFLSTLLVCTCTAGTAGTADLLLQRKHRAVSGSSENTLFEDEVYIRHFTDVKSHISDQFWKHHRHPKNKGKSAMPDRNFSVQKIREPFSAKTREIDAEEKDVVLYGVPANGWRPTAKSVSARLETQGISMLATVGERPFVPPREASFVDSPEKMVIDSVRSSVRDSSTFTFTRPATETTMASAKGPAEDVRSSSFGNGNHVNGAGPDFNQGLRATSVFEPGSDVSTRPLASSATTTSPSTLSSAAVKTEPLVSNVSNTASSVSLPEKEISSDPVAAVREIVPVHESVQNVHKNSLSGSPRINKQRPRHRSNRPFKRFRTPVFVTRSSRPRSSGMQAFLLRPIRNLQSMLRNSVLVG